MPKTQSSRPTPPERHYHRGLPAGAAPLQYPGLLFLWQRWLEALDQGSQVSVQAPTTGARTLLREWSEVRARAAEDEGRGVTALRAVEEEAFGLEIPKYSKIHGTIASDPLLAERIKLFAPGAESLTTAHTGQKAAENVVNARRTLAAKELEGWMDQGYLLELARQLEAVVFPHTVAMTPAGQPSIRASEVAAIERLGTAMISELLSRGFSPTFLRRHARMLVKPNNSSIAEQARFRDFVSRFYQPAVDTTVFFKVQGSREFWSAWPESGDLRSADDLATLLKKPATPSDSSFAKTGTQRMTRFVRWIGPAMDRASATSAAFRAFERLCDFAWASDPAISDPVVLSVGTIRPGRENHIEVVEFSRTEAVFRPPRHSAARQARPFAGETARLAAVTQPGDNERTARARQRIIGALRAARAATAQRWTENRIATLWTAVEVLAHEDYGPHIIERVVRSVVPFVAVGKVRDLTDDIAEYLRMSPLASDVAVQAQLGDAIATSSPTGRAALLGKLADPSVAQTLVYAADKSPLVAFRIQEYHEAVVSGKSLAGRVFRTSQRVDWQLRRIYRHRNDHLHGGRMDFATDRLHEHLYLYVMTMLDPIGKALQAATPATSLEEIITRMDSDVQSWLDWMKNLKEPVAKLDSTTWMRLYNPLAIEDAVPVSIPVSTVTAGQFSSGSPAPTPGSALKTDKLS